MGIIMFTIMDDDGSITMVAEPSPEYTYTYADYLKWKFEERLELFRGRIFKLSAPNTKHQVLAGKLHLRIGNFLENQPCYVFIAPFDVRLPAKNTKKDDEITTVVQPDLCIVCDKTKIDERGCCGAPDLIIEILSPGNSQKEVRIKFELYEEAGVKEYWLINPAEENLIIYLLNDEGKFSGGKMYAAGDIIFSDAIRELCIDVSDIFKN
jgi:Uma2 family endonuclease